MRDADGTRRGMEAVIDKDLASAHIANILGYEILVLLTKAPSVAVDCGTPQVRWISETSVSELRALQAQGHFPAGSIRPKMEAELRFVEKGSQRVDYRVIAGSHVGVARPSREACCAWLTVLARASTSLRGDMPNGVTLG